MPSPRVAAVSEIPLGTFALIARGEGREAQMERLREFHNVFWFIMRTEGFKHPTRHVLY